MLTEIVMVGAFPPPVVGLATTNSAVYDHLRELGSMPRIINTSAPSLDRSLITRLRRFGRIVLGLARLATMRGINGGAFYISISGGGGKLYDVAFILIARIRRMRVFARHCSFAYLDKPTFFARAVVVFSGKTATHVTQCKKMADMLGLIYGASNVIPISNAVLYPMEDTGLGEIRRELRTLGFLSNLSAEKGIVDYLELMAAIQDLGLPLRGRIAGAFYDTKTECLVRDWLGRLHCVEYVGPVYDAEKEAFLSSIDVLIFPTRYKDETEAKVNHEAMRHGIPVIAYGRGCIPEVVGKRCGKVVDPDSPFIPEALAKIQDWSEDSAAFVETCGAARTRFLENRLQNEQRWRSFLRELTECDSRVCI